MLCEFLSLQCYAQHSDERIIAAVQFEIKLFDFFSTGLNSSLIIFVRTYTVNCQNALDRLRVHMNVILFVIQLFNMYHATFFAVVIDSFRHIILIIYNTKTDAKSCLRAFLYCLLYISTILYIAVEKCPWRINIRVKNVSKKFVRGNVYLDGKIKC